jgi:hypothetical protein
MNRPTFTYGLQLPYHSPADMARKIRTMKLFWFVLPVVISLGNGSLWTDPYDPSGPKSFQWAAVYGVLITWGLGLAIYFAIRFASAKFRPKPLVNRIPREARPDPRARVPQPLPDQLRTNHSRALLQ